MVDYPNLARVILVIAAILHNHFMYAKEMVEHLALAIAIACLMIAIQEYALQDLLMLSLVALMINVVLRTAVMGSVNLQV